MSQRSRDGGAECSVSIIIPSYNAADFISDALQSVAEQTLQDWECIVVDDASSDHTCSVVEAFCEREPRCRLIRLSKNGGESIARNRGFDEARGRWLAIVDADDLYMPDRLERLVEMGDRLDADMVFDELLISAFPNKTPFARAFYYTDAEFEFSQEDYFSRSRVFKAQLPAGYMQPILRREYLESTGYRYDPEIRSGPDFYLYAQLFASRVRCFGTNYAGYIYRRRQGSVSKSSDTLHYHAPLTDRIMANHEHQLSSVSRQALSDRKRDFESLAKAMGVLDARRAGNWAQMIRAGIAKPVALLVLLRLARMRLSRVWLKARAGI